MERTYEDFEPSAFGFRSIRARTRQERRALNDKVALEKNRINQRTGYAARMQRENAPDSSAGLTTCIEGGAGYMNDSDRFHSDTAGEEYQRRQENLIKKQRALEFRRNQASNREDERYTRLEEKRKEEEEKWDRLRENGSKAMKNKSKAAYDITTLQYYANDDGEAQKYVDDMVRYRASVRTHQLVVQGDSRVQYNIISGSDKEVPPLPRTVPNKPANYALCNVDKRRGYN